MMQKILAEKRRRRRDSTGSLDGTLITSDGRLLRQRETIDVTNVFLTFFNVFFYFYTFLV